MAARVTPLIVIVGETASGKSALALKIAEDVGGEIIAADSRTIYKGMDIGTAKPTSQEQKRIRHHLLSIVEPNESYSAAQFKSDALRCIDDISNRGKVPILVGGTGLYINSLIFDYEFRSVDLGRRAEVEQLSLAELQEEAKKLGIEPEAVNFKNKRHLQRAVETGEVLNQEQQLRENTLVLGIGINKETLEQRIKSRTEHMVEQGYAEETKKLGDIYGWDTPALNGIGYRYMGAFVRGEVTIEEAKNSIRRGDLSLAKRQRTWFKRNKYIHWISTPSEALTLVHTFLSRVE